MTGPRDPDRDDGLKPMQESDWDDAGEGWIYEEEHGQD